jgi:hypothetical protein
VANPLFGTSCVHWKGEVSTHCGVRHTQIKASRHHPATNRVSIDSGYHEIAPFVGGFSYYFDLEDPRSLARLDQPMTALEGENQLALLGPFLKQKGDSPELTNMFQKLLEYYAKYQNTYVKHNDAVIEEEIEIVFEITASFMKHLVRLNAR